MAAENSLVLISFNGIDGILKDNPDIETLQGGGGGTNSEGASHARGVQEHAPAENFEMYTF